MRKPSAHGNAVPGDGAGGVLDGLWQHAHFRTQTIHSEVHNRVDVVHIKAAPLVGRGELGGEASRGGAGSDSEPLLFPYLCRPRPLEASFLGWVQLNMAVPGRAGPRCTVPGDTTKQSSHLLGLLQSQHNERTLRK